MKKLAIAAAAAAALTSGVVNAYTTGTFSNGFVVPNVIHNGPGDTTAVGLLSNGNYAVHWVFYDENSVHQRDGCFVMTANDFEPFIWAAPKTGNTTMNVSNLAGKRGYLVFAVGTDSAANRDGGALKTNCNNYENVFLPSQTTAANATIQALAGAAFHVKSASSDVAYVPVIDGPLVSQLTTPVSFSAAIDDPVTYVGGATDGNDTHFVRFYTAGGAKTEIVIWNSAAYDATSNQYNKVAYVYGDKQDSFGSITLPLKNKELNVFDVQVVTSGTPNDGFFRWTPMPNVAGVTTRGVFTYSMINAPSFGALQTIVNPYVQNP